MRNIILGTLLLLCCNSVAQISRGGFPLCAKGVSLKSGETLPEIVMPKADFKAEMENDKKLKQSCVNKFAHKFNVDIDIKENGQKTTTNGYNVWRLAIKSEGAYSLNLIFKDLNLPQGARLFLHTPQKEQILGAYTQANNTPHLFATTPLDGEKMIVHYEEPENATEKATIIIKSVNHDYKGLRLLPDYGVSQSCQIEAKHDTVHLNTKRSACLFIIDGNYNCSGNLINNVENDGNPYILSSAHCFYKNGIWDTTLDTSKAQTIVAFFNYEAPNRKWDLEGTREQSLSGAHTIAFNKKRDMLLLRMNDVPPADYMTYYAGWNRENNVDGEAYDFHHPNGDVKKITTSKGTPVEASYDDGELFYTNSHWLIENWDQGVTENGSSGSGLFNNEDLLIGALSGGQSYCSTPGGDYYWQFGKAWSDSSGSARNCLSYWLDPNNTGVTIHPGRDPYKNPCQRISHLGLDELPSTENVTDGYVAGTNTLGIDEVAEKFVVEGKSSLYGVYFIPKVGSYDDSYPIFIHIYSGKDKPTTLIHEQRVKIQTSQYKRNLQRTELVTTNYWSETENYVRFDSPIKVDSCFFVAFSFPEEPISNSKFALYYNDKKAQNTAFYHTNKGWEPYTNHPVVGAKTALMVDAVVNDGWGDPERLEPITPTDTSHIVSPLKTDGKIVIFPSVTENTLTISMPKDEKLKSIKITDMQGHTLYEKNGISITGTYSFATGGYCLQENTYLLIAEFKLSGKKTFKFLKR